MADKATTEVLSPDGVVIADTTPASTGELGVSQSSSEAGAGEPSGSEVEFDISAFDVAKTTATKDELGAKKQEVSKPTEAAATKTASEETEVKMTPAEADVRRKAENPKLNDVQRNTPVPPKAQSQANKSATPRDLADIPEEDQPLFKSMSNDAFNKLKPIYKEYGTLKSAQEANAKKLQEQEALIAQLKQGLQPVPDNYYEHENAFVLTPEFSNASADVSLAESVRNHWQSQLEKVMSGEKTYNTLVRDAQGTIRLSQPLPVDTATESTLRNNLAFAFEQVGQRKATLDNVAQQFRAKSKEASTWLGQWEKGTFPIFDKANGKELVDQAKDLVSKFPSAYRSNPLVQALAKSLVLNNKFVALLQAGQQQQQTQKTVPKKQTAKAPSLAEVNGDGGSGDGKAETEVSFDDFEKVKQGL